MSFPFGSWDLLDGTRLWQVIGVAMKKVGQVGVYADVPAMSNSVTPISETVKSSSVSVQEATELFSARRPEEMTAGIAFSRHYRALSTLHRDHPFFQAEYDSEEICNRVDRIALRDEGAHLGMKPPLSLRLSSLVVASFSPLSPQRLHPHPSVSTLIRQSLFHGDV